MRKLFTVILALGLLAGLSACSKQRANTPSVKENVERSLDNAGMKDVNVKEDRDKGVVTLGGKVQSPEQKAQAEDLAKQAAGGLVVANEISIEPQGMAGDAKKIESNLDDAIEKDYKAAIIANHLDKQHIRSDSKNGVLTLKGDVDSVQQREAAEQIGAKTPNVTQVVNELEVKGGKKRK
jgi:hyperosmotically inducible protein